MRRLGTTPGMPSSGQADTPTRQPTSASSSSSEDEAARLAPVSAEASASLARLVEVAQAAA